MLDDITLYWLTNSATSSARLYWENNNNNFNAVEQKTAEISVPVGVTVFPGEIYRAPKSWAQRAYPNADLLQPGGQGRPLRGLGTAGTLRGRDPRGVQSPAVIGATWTMMQLEPVSRATRGTPRGIRWERDQWPKTSAGIAAAFWAPRP